LAEGAEIPEVCKALEVRAVLLPLAGPVRRDEADDVRRLKELECENASLKRLVADKELDRLSDSERSARSAS
jgi:hypothetical protein